MNSKTMKTIISLMVVLLLAFSAVTEETGSEAAGNEAPTVDEAPAGGVIKEELEEIREELREEVEEEKAGDGVEEEVEEEIVLEVEPGLTPDSPFYFIDELLERPGNDPEKALEYKEEKMAEALVMVRENKVEEAREALERYADYGEIVEKEVTPEMGMEVKQDTQEMKSALNKISQELPEIDVERLVELEERIRMAAEVSSQIKKLCQALSELDPVQYAKICQTDDDAPKWRIGLHKELTDEQKEHAELFASKMKQCFESQGQQCDCEGMGVQSFVDLCRRGSVKAAACREGDFTACQSIVDQDAFEALPDYLRPVMEELMAGFKEPAPPEGFPPGREGEFPGDHIGPPEGIEEFGRDCQALQGEEKMRCFEEFYDRAKGQFSQDFAQKYDIQREIPPAEHPSKWITSFEEKFAAAGSDSQRKSILNEIKKAANQRGFVVDEMGGEEGGFFIKLIHEDETEFSYNYGGGFEVTAECREVGALSPVACRKHMEGVRERMSETTDEECRAVGALSPEACARHLADVTALGPGCDDCDAQCPGASRSDCINNRCECFYEEERPEEEWPGDEHGDELPDDNADYSEDNTGDSNPDGSGDYPQGDDNGPVEAPDTGSSGGSESSGDSGGSGDSGSSGGSESSGDSGGSGDSGSSGGSESSGDSGGSITGGVVYFPSPGSKKNAVTGFFSRIFGIE